MELSQDVRMSKAGKTDTESTHEAPACMAAKRRRVTELIP